LYLFLLRRGGERAEEDGEVSRGLIWGFGVLNLGMWGMGGERGARGVGMERERGLRCVEEGDGKVDEVAWCVGCAGGWLLDG
jgi:hypothetical protein